MTLISENDPRVIEVVKRILALRRLALVERMQTSRSQTALLKSLPEDLLAAVAVRLESAESSELKIKYEENRSEHQSGSAK
jgi:hypothetical protein